MTHDSYPQSLARFERLVRRRERGATMAALIVDSPWLPGYAGISTVDFYFDPGAWIDAYGRAHADLPGVALLPGAWVEFGMAAEPSGWGVPVRWHADAPPAVGPHPGGLGALAAMEPPDPERDGFMPVVLRQYERMMPALKARGMAPRMAAARGPLAVAAHLAGMTEFLTALKLEPANVERLLDATTDLCIRWLESQLRRMDDPVGVLVLDDLVGMMSPKDAARFAFPRLRRILGSFDGLIRVFHNDTPNDRVFEGLAGVGMDVFNFSHMIGAARARELLGPGIVLMGNVPPVDVLVRGTPDDVRRAVRELVEEAAVAGPLVVSAGGGVSPETPIENLKALADAVREA